MPEWLKYLLELTAHEMKQPPMFGGSVCWQSGISKAICHFFICNVAADCEFLRCFTSFEWFCSKTQDEKTLLCLPSSQSFKIMTRENDLRIMSILLQASYAGESKTMPFLIIREHTFYGLFSLRIDFLELISTADLFWLFQVFLPQMAMDHFCLILTMCALINEWAVSAVFGIALIFSVSFSIRCSVSQLFIIRT